MNIHIIFVHFPIALLTVYGILELAHFCRLLALSYWFYLKAVFVIFGEVGALAALLTGDTATEQFRYNPIVRQVINTHSNFGAATAILFGIIALLYLIAWLGRTGILTRYGWSGALTNKIERLIASWLMPIAAIVGLVLVTITGALGGAIAFGPDVDPVSKFVYSWLIH
jgi:uncharacterized membrane protein